VLSVLILTHNEEANIEGCLESASWSDDVCVFDSFSEDKTTDIARKHSARVIEHAFINYGLQREAARAEGGFKHEWVLAVDADERPDAQLVQELSDISLDFSNMHSAYRMRRKDHFMGRWIKHSTLYPSWFVRFFRHRKVHYEPRAVHEYPTVDGTVGELRGHLLHYSFNKGIEDWWAKHRKYAELEAKAEIESLKSGGDWRGLISLDPVRRRRALKRASYTMPGRPLLRFLYMYVLRGGVLDGLPGYRYCRMLSEYERMIVANLRDLRDGGSAGKT
jgi:glycosyltransferase involved in cell wall biosynthesis